MNPKGKMKGKRKRSEDEEAVCCSPTTNSQVIARQRNFNDDDTAKTAAADPTWKSLERDVVIEHILKLVSRKDVVEIMSIDEINKYFRLEESFCNVHGTRLEVMQRAHQQESSSSSSEEEEEEGEDGGRTEFDGSGRDSDSENADDLSDNDVDDEIRSTLTFSHNGVVDNSASADLDATTNDSSNNGTATSKKQCIDCFKLKLDQPERRCDECDTFQVEERLVVECEDCGFQGCTSCVKGYPIFRCGGHCNRLFCKICPQEGHLVKCDNCSVGFCHSCWDSLPARHVVDDLGTEGNLCSMRCWQADQELDSEDDIGCWDSEYY